MSRSKLSPDDDTGSHRHRNTFPAWGWIWLPLITRISISLLTRTFFVPDEHFQSTEPAHRMVFGFGHLTWEWVSPQPIRSFSFPSLFVPVFYTLKLLRLDNMTVLVRAAYCTRLAVLSQVALQIWAPKVLTGIVASITDSSVYQLAYLLFGRQYATVAVRAQF
jgi:phosphatidylinositol glycan class B